MPKDGSATRKKILDAAQALILERGYAGMSVDRVIEAAGLTKGAFFYHFKSKNDLAWSLIQQFGEADQVLMNEFTAKAKKLSRDPLQQLLIFIGLFEDMFEEMQVLHPGCLFASYTYELQHFNGETREYLANGFNLWRMHLKDWLDTVAEVYPPRIPVDMASLADEFNVTLEGAFVMAKAMQDKAIIPQQLRHFRNYLELLFLPEKN